MQQMMHIFRKDLRNLWLQIALALLLLAGYVWDQTKPARAPEGTDLVSLFVLQYAVFLVPLGWWALIVRSVLEEPLVGDRQFWITRPYDWRSLLGAKLVFILISVNLPLFIAQMLFLEHAGYSPVPHMGDLLVMQLYDSVLMILPAFVLTTISGSIARTLFTSLGAVAYVAVLAYFASTRGPDSPSAGNFQGWFSAVVFFTTAVMIVYWQYSQRAITKSRYMLAACALVVPLAMWFTPYNALFARDYPVLSIGNVPAAMRLNTSKPPAPKISTDADQFEFILPMLAEHITDGVYLRVQTIRIQLQGAQFHWDSGWKGNYTELFPGDNEFNVGFDLKRKQFLPLRGGPISLRVSLALTQSATTDSMQVVAHDEFEIPGIAHCRMDYHRLSEVSCRAGTQYPALLATVAAGASTCPSGKDRPASFSWFSGSDAGPGIDPVQNFNLWFRGPGVALGSENNVLCPGTPIVVSHIYPTRSFRVELPEVQIRLEDYREVPSDLMYGIHVLRH